MPTDAQHVEELASQLANGETELNADTAYYEAESRLKAIGIATPPEMRELVAAVGWPRMYLDSLEERLDVSGFRLAGESEADERLWDWWTYNQLDEESGMAHLDSLVHGRSYVTVAAPDPADPDSDPQIPIIRVESPRTMTAETNPRTRKVERALRLYTEPGRPDEEAATLYLPDRTVLLSRSGNSGSGWRATQTIRHGLGAVPVVPIYNRQRLADRTGRSEILPELRSMTDAAARTVMNMQAATELMAVPQRLLFGVAKDEFANNPDNPGATLEAYYARIMAFENEAGSATQFDAAELRNFTDVLQELAKQVASYTGLPPQYLSFSSDNPASAEAIRSSEARLVKKCERKARMFGGAWEQVMRLGMKIIDGSVSSDAYRMEARWQDPATPTYAAKADGAQKLVGGRPVIPVERARIDMGYSEEERRQMQEWDEQEQEELRLSALYAPAAQQGSAAPADESGPPAEQQEVSPRAA